MPCCDNLPIDNGRHGLDHARAFFSSASVNDETTGNVRKGSFNFLSHRRASTGSSTTATTINEDWAGLPLHLDAVAMMWHDHRPPAALLVAGNSCVPVPVSPLEAP
jgi:hypothetical protein